MMPDVWSAWAFPCVWPTATLPCSPSRASSRDGEAETARCGKCAISSWKPGGPVPGGGRAGMAEYTPYRAGHHFVKEYDPAQFGERFAEYRRKWTTYPKNQILSDFPINVDLELASMCNLKCPMCHTVYIKNPSFKAYEAKDMTRL